jgi:hypothetical protein
MAWLYQLSIQLTDNVTSQAIDSEGHFSLVDEFLDRAESVDRINGSGTRCGQRRCKKRDEHHGQGRCDVDEWIGSTHVEEE